MSILNNEYMIISVIGSHAGENEEEIFRRKINDIDSSGKTFWLIKSWQAKPDMVQEICRHAEDKNKNVYCIFIEASTFGGAVPTKQASSAQYYSSDNSGWLEIPDNISPVTGKIDRSAYALIFDNLKMYDGNIDLWDYADFFNQSNPVKISQGASTLCATRQDMRDIQNKIKSRFRRIVAIGKLCKPFGVWLAEKQTYNQSLERDA